jgi:hypothetical protein
MKNIFLAAALTLSSFSVWAQQKTFTCQDIYIKSMNHKEVLKSKVGRINDAAPGLLIVISAVNPIAGVSFLGAAVGSEIYTSTASKEEKVLRLTEESNKQLKKLVKKLNKKISCEITEEEVRTVIQKGLEDGTFCRNFPQLYTVGDIKKHVEQMMIIKHVIK